MPPNPEGHDESLAWLKKELDSIPPVYDLENLQQSNPGADLRRETTPSFAQPNQEPRGDDVKKCAVLGGGCIALGGSLSWVSKQEWLTEVIDVYGKVFMYLGSITCTAGAVAAGTRFIKNKRSAIDKK